MPGPAELKGTKAVIIVKAREETDSDEGGFPTGIANEVVFMEINKPVLENLYNISQVSYTSHSNQNELRQSAVFGHQCRFDSYC